MKYILVIGDGMADNPVPELNLKTPLEYSKMPQVSSLAEKSVIGSVLTVPQGLPPGSDTAILSILGCDPRIYYTGRAPLEAAGCGFTVNPGDVAYRCNMVTFAENAPEFENKQILSHNAGSIEGGESVELINFLFKHPEFGAADAKMNVVPNPSFRHIAVQKNAVTDGIILTPPHDILGKIIGSYLPKGTSDAETLKTLMKQAHILLDGHSINIHRRKQGKLPANGIWFWAEGTAAKLPSFSEKYKKTGAVISAVPLVTGIGNLIGLTPVDVPGITGELDTNYEGKADFAVNTLKNGCDFVVLHVEAPDECTHCGDLDGKLKALEYIDSRIIGEIVRKMSGIPYRMLFLSDHKTLTSTRGHDGDPVPFMLYDSEKEQNGCPHFDENSAKNGKFLENGTELLGILFESGGI